MDCAICEQEINKGAQTFAISKDNWTGKLSENPETMTVCHLKCVKNAIEIMDSIMRED